VTSTVIIEVPGQWVPTTLRGDLDGRVVDVHEEAGGVAARVLLVDVSFLRPLHALLGKLIDAEQADAPPRSLSELDADDLGEGTP
jgi:hypothetical protein